MILRDTFVLVVLAGLLGWLLSNVQPLSWLQWRPLIDPAAPYPSLFESLQVLLLGTGQLLPVPLIAHVLACWGVVALAHSTISRPMVRDVVAGLGTLVLPVVAFVWVMTDDDIHFHPATDRLSVALQDSILVWAVLGFASYIAIQAAARRFGWWTSAQGHR